MYEIDRNEYYWLMGYVRASRRVDRQIKTIVEFGPGESTKAFTDAGASVTSYEFDLSRVEKAREAIRRYTAFALVYGVVGGVESIPMPRCDMVFVDAPVGGSEPLAWLKTCEWGILACGHVLLHDAGRQEEQNIIKILASRYPMDVEIFEYGRKTAIMKTNELVIR